MMIHEYSRINCLNYCASAGGLTAARTKITLPSEMPTTHSAKEKDKKKIKPSHQVEKNNEIENKSVNSRLGKVLKNLIISKISIRYIFTGMSLYYTCGFRNINTSENRKGKLKFCQSSEHKQIRFILYIQTTLLLSPGVVT